MKKICRLLGLLLSLPAIAQNGLEEMIQAEKQFAAMAVASGTKAAFLQFADTASVMFSKGEPVNGYQLWKEREQRPGVLNWQPRFAEVAASGDYGYTCGPWTFQASTPDDPVVATGYFFTVWKKNSAGQWKFILDVGTDAGPRVSDENVVRIEAQKQKGVEITMLEAESAFIRSYKMDSVEAYSRFLSDLSVTSREGTGLTAKQKTAASTGNNNEGALSFSALGSGIAPSGDIGFVYGSAALDGKKEAYLRIWRREPGGWKIALQVVRL